MENGFSPAPSPFETIEDRVRRIPLPNQMPMGLDFTGIPAAALKSSTLESLITQNEDLMARLSVTLRKVAELEGSVTRTERDQSLLRSRFETLKEQYMVLREKDRLSVTRGVDLQRQNVAARERGEKLERQFASVFVQGQAFQRRLRHLERYRARVKVAAVNLRERARASTALRRDLATAQDDLRRLTAGYDARLAEATDRVASLTDKAREHDRLFQENVALQNQMVHEKRQFANGRADAQGTIDRLAAETADLRRELKDLLIERENQARELTGYAEELPALRATRDDLTDQVESLQSLWSAKQRELEQLEEKNRNLQKLNQSLSVTLNEQRRELTDQRGRFEQERFATEERLRTLQRELKLVRKLSGQVNDEMA